MSTAGTSLYDQLTQAFDASPRDTWRKEAFESFRASGFPTIRDEDWRFTNLAPFLKEGYQPEVANPTDKLAVVELLRDNTIEGWDAYRVVLVNGVPDFSLSELPEDGEITIMPLAEALGSPLFESNAGKHLDTKVYRMAGLNAALSRDGICIEVAPGKRAAKPLHLIHLYTSDVPAFFQPRHLFVMRRQSELRFMETSACVTGTAPILVNSLIEGVLEDGARLKHCVLQSGRKGERVISHTQVSQSRDSVYENITISLPEADLMRNQLNVTLDGTGSECHLYGLYLPADQQLVDNHTVVDHRQPHCESNELYKGVLQGSAKAVFNGKIFVRQAAQKTNAFQQNNNLLLGEKALVHSKPQLEIFADDVKCSHGSTIGQFNPESLFYLRARGIGEEMAKELLVEAFGADITDRVSSAAVQKHLEKHMRKEKPAIQLKDVPHVEHI